MFSPIQAVTRALSEITGKDYSLENDNQRAFIHKKLFDLMESDPEVLDKFIDLVKEFDPDTAKS